MTNKAVKMDTKDNRYKEGETEEEKDEGTKDY